MRQHKELEELHGAVLVQPTDTSIASQAVKNAFNQITTFVGACPGGLPR